MRDEKAPRQSNAAQVSKSNSYFLIPALASDMIALYEAFMSADYIFIGNILGDVIRETGDLPENLNEVSDFSPSTCDFSRTFLNDAIELAHTHRVYLISRLGRDPMGDVILDTCRKNNINTVFVSRQFNTVTPHRMRFESKNGDVTRAIGRNVNCDITVEDIARAQAILLGCKRIYLEQGLRQDVKDAVRDLSRRFNVTMEDRGIPTGFIDNHPVARI